MEGSHHLGVIYFKFRTSSIIVELGGFVYALVAVTLGFYILLSYPLHSVFGLFRLELYTVPIIILVHCYIVMVVLIYLSCTGAVAAKRRTLILLAEL